MAKASILTERANAPRPFQRAPDPVPVRKPMPPPRRFEAQAPPTPAPPTVQAALRRPWMPSLLQGRAAGCTLALRAVERGHGRVEEAATSDSDAMWSARPARDVEICFRGKSWRTLSFGREPRAFDRMTVLPMRYLFAMWVWPCTHTRHIPFLGDLAFKAFAYADRGPLPAKRGVEPKWLGA